jgi:hypothetical protein
MLRVAKWCFITLIGMAWMKLASRAGSLVAVFFFSKENKENFYKKMHAS